LFTSDDKGLKPSAAQGGPVNKYDSFLYAQQLSRRFKNKKGQDLVVFENLELTLSEGEFVCVIGHSGCGKSTILNILAGLDEPTEGYVFMEGRQVTKPGLDRGVIFQNHSLLPWKTALSNVMFSVRARFPDWDRKKLREHSLKYLEMVGLSAALDRRPAQLSGGMRQRVGIARAFAIQPRLLLMDEPFGALDALTRGTIQDELLRLWGNSGQTVFMITHDVDEAIYLADRVLLMSTGPYAQVEESVSIDIPRPRDRRTLVRHPRYYEIRNHLVDFLTSDAATSNASRSQSPDKQPSAAPITDGETTTDDPTLMRQIEAS
jgi:nitrate/nitrite transport system ATP-binding protein